MLEVNVQALNVTYFVLNSQVWKVKEIFELIMHVNFRFVYEFFSRCKILILFFFLLWQTKRKTLATQIFPSIADAYKINP